MAEPQKSGTGQGLFQKKKGVNENTSIKMLLSIHLQLVLQDIEENLLISLERIKSADHCGKMLLIC